MTLRSALSSLVAFSSLALVGCGPKLTSMKVQPEMATLQAMNDTTKLTTQQLDGDGKPMKKAAAVTWASSDDSIASIGADGTATAHKSGKVTVTAKVNKLQATGAVEVHIPAKITTKDLAFQGFGQTQTISLQVLDDQGQPMDSATAKMTVTISSGTSVTVDGPIGGPWTVKSAAAGASKLTATSGSLTQDFAANVKPPEVTGLKLDPLSLRMKVGDTAKLTATPLAGADPIAGLVPTFTSSNPAVASVDSDGTVKATGKGKATITVVAGGKQGTVKAEVRK